MSCLVPQTLTHRLRHPLRSPLLPAPLPQAAGCPGARCSPAAAQVGACGAGCCGGREGGWAREKRPVCFCLLCHPSSPCREPLAACLCAYLRVPMCECAQLCRSGAPSSPPPRTPRAQPGAAAAVRGRRVAGVFRLSTHRAMKRAALCVPGGPVCGGKAVVALPRPWRRGSGGFTSHRMGSAGRGHQPRAGDACGCLLPPPCLGLLLHPPAPATTQQGRDGAAGPVLVVGEGDRVCLGACVDNSVSMLEGCEGYVCVRT